MKNILKLILLIAVAYYGFAFLKKKEAIMSYKGKELLELILNKNELKKYLPYDFSIEIDSSIFHNYKILYKKSVEDVIGDTISLIYKEGNNYYLLNKPFQQYSNLSQEVKEKQSPAEIQRVSEYIIKTKHLPCIFIISDNSKEIFKQSVELEASI